MPPSRRPIRQTRRAQDDLAFPVPFNEQARFLALAARFLELDGRRPGRHVIPIEQRTETPQKGKKKAA